MFAIVSLGAILTERAMVTTEERLLMQIPAVATIIYEASDTPQTTPWRQPTREELHAIGALPYVKVYDFTVRPVFYSEGLVWPHEDNPGMRLRGRPFEGRGVNIPEIADIETGIVQLIDGRTFTQEEIDDHALVVVVPRDIAEVNGLTVGSVIELENVIHNFFSESEYDRVLAIQILEVEIIGIIGRDIGDMVGDPDFFYMPAGLTENMLDFRADTFRTRVEELLDQDEERFRELGQEILQYEPQIDSLFVLNTPRELEDFSIAAMALLPDDWVVVGIDESIFSHVTTSMDLMLQLADSVRWGATVAMTIALILILLLFLHDRRHEIGIYRALGDKKHQVLIQFLTEVGLITVVAFTFAILIGSIFSESISAYLFEQHLIEQINSDLFYVTTPVGLELHNPGMMSVEEALSLYDVALDVRTIIIFVSIGAVMVSVSTLIPTWYALKSEPQKLLS